MIGDTAKCAVCGKEFVKKIVNQIYCSRGCYKEGRKAKTREWWRRKQKENRKKNISEVFATDGIGCLDYTPKYEYNTAPTPRATADYVNTGDYLAREYIGKVITI